MEVRTKPSKHIGGNPRGRRGRLYLRYSSRPNFYIHAALPALAPGAFAMLSCSLAQRRTVAPFVCTLRVPIASFAGHGAAFFPCPVPGSVSVYAAAAAPNTLVFLRAIVSFFIPITIFYHVYQCAVFSGKLEEYAGYAEERASWPVRHPALH